MLKSEEQDEFIAVRVQDPRLQNEGSWNSYVDYKIFLHTNSKAFTAKTSCVRRRYSEFVWLKKKLQKNTGLVPVPDLPKKSYFSFINDDFIERRRKGLQSFLDKVLHMTVCLSDSQLHLFLQTQLPIKHIEDCVQGHTPYTVTEAILTYASSNRGWAQEEGAGAQDVWTAPVTYESTESPAPHVPTLSGLKPLSEFTDVSDLDTVLILSDTELTGSDLKEESDYDQKIEVLEAESDGCEYHVPQIDSPLEDLDGLDKAVQDISICQRNNDEIKDHQNVTQEQIEHTENDLVKVADKTWKDVALDGANISEENIPEDQAEITDAIQENGISDEDSSINTSIQKEQRDETICTDLDINETHLSPSDCSEDHVDEVNEINAKSIHTASAVLILEEALDTQTTPVMDTVQNVNTGISYEDRNLDANAADVNTFVLQAIEIDSVQSQENYRIIAAQQPDAK